MFEGPRHLYSGEEVAEVSIHLMAAYNHTDSNYKDNSDQLFSGGADVTQWIIASSFESWH